MALLVHGRIVLAHRTVLTVNAAHLRTQAQAAADRLRGQNQTTWKLAEHLAPYLATAARQAVATSYPVQRYAAP
jgi:hypothetical protein